MRTFRQQNPCIGNKSTIVKNGVKNTYLRRYFDTIFDSASIYREVVKMTLSVAEHEMLFCHQLNPCNNDCVWQMCFVEG